MSWRSICGALMVAACVAVVGCGGRDAAVAPDVSDGAAARSDRADGAVAEGNRAEDANAAAGENANLAEVDAHVLADADPDRAEDERGAFCSAPLPSNVGIASLADVPMGDWCAATFGRIVEWTCEGMTAIAIGIGGDCDREYLFDAGSGRLRAVTFGCNGAQGCEGGDPAFVPAWDCWSGNIPFPLTYPCVDAGVPEAGAQGTRPLCHVTADCPTGYVCGYSVHEPCWTSGFCVYPNMAHDPVCAPTTYCACDGTTTEGCAGDWALKPVPTLGQTATCRD